MAFNKCENCKEYHWSDEDCKPEFVVVYDDYTGEEGTIIRGSSFYDAAVRFAEYYNTSCDYCLMGDVIEIEVKRNGNSKKFKVGAEPSVDYSADEI